MKVYCVFQGCYSDRDCIAVFDNKEQAEQYSNALNDIDYSDVEEFELNQITRPITKKKVRCWYALIWIKDIVVCFAGIQNYSHKKGDLEESEGFEIVDISHNKRNKIEKDIYYIRVISYVSKEHAKKVAIEQYQIYTQQQFEDGEL